MKNLKKSEHCWLSGGKRNEWLCMGGKWILLQAVKTYNGWCCGRAGKVGFDMKLQIIALILFTAGYMMAEYLTRGYFAFGAEVVFVPLFVIYIYLHRKDGENE